MKMGTCKIHGEIKFTKSRHCPKCKIEWRKNQRLKLIQEFGGKCERCGYSKCLGALHFHHKDHTEKSFGLNAANSISYKKKVEEAKKCILVCSNCHIELHEEEGYLYTKPKEGKDA